MSCDGGSDNPATVEWRARADGVAVESFDVVVVGGGISGLAAARRLVGEGVERVAVVDAREEVGGRCLRASCRGPSP